MGLYTFPFWEATYLLSSNTPPNPWEARSRERKGWIIDTGVKMRLYGTSRELIVQRLMQLSPGATAQCQPPYLRFFLRGVYLSTSGAMVALYVLGMSKLLAALRAFSNVFASKSKYSGAHGVLLWGILPQRNNGHHKGIVCSNWTPQRNSL